MSRLVGEIVVRERVVEVLQAPPLARISLELLASADPRSLRVTSVGDIEVGSAAVYRPVEVERYGVLLCERVVPPVDWTTERGDGSPVDGPTDVTGEFESADPRAGTTPSHDASSETVTKPDSDPPSREETR